MAGSGHGLIRISLISRKVRHLLLKLSALCFSSFPFKSFAHLSTRLSLSDCKNSLYLMDTHPFSFLYIANIFYFPVLAFLFL